MTASEYRISAYRITVYGRRATSAPTSDDDLQRRHLMEEESGRSPAAVGPLAVTFDALVERLSATEGVFVEPDGSFVWRTREGQVDGQIQDGRTGIDHIQLRVRCSHKMWDRLLRIIGPPAQPLLVQLTEEGILLTAEQFRQRLVDSQMGGKSTHSRGG